jgi:hypothetical protein
MAKMLHASLRRGRCVIIFNALLEFFIASLIRYDMLLLLL